MSVGKNSVIGLKEEKPQVELIKMVDEILTLSINIMDAFGLPRKQTKKKLRHRQFKMQPSFATEVPFKTMMLCYECMEVVKAWQRSVTRIL